MSLESCQYNQGAATLTLPGIMVHSGLVKLDGASSLVFSLLSKHRNFRKINCITTWYSLFVCMRHSPMFGLVFVAILFKLMPSVHNVIRSILPTFDLQQHSILQLKGEAYSHM